MKEKTHCVLMVGPDVQMDHMGSSYEPANPPPAKCPHCTFPDLDFVPTPYLLTKGVGEFRKSLNAQLKPLSTNQTVPPHVGC